MKKLVTYLGGGGRRYTLGARIGGGGEGDIYDLGNRMVVKVYKSPDHAQAQKVKAMVSLRPPSELSGLLAWPADVLSDQAGNFVGFIMPKVGSKYLFDDFTRYPYLEIHPHHNGYMTYYVVAMNLAYVVSRLHEMGVVIGDFNGENFGFTDTGSPVVYDCDSFGIIGRFRCYACRQEYTAPWLDPALRDGLKNYRGQTFTFESDDFALAIHVFELLMNGCHPYASVPTGNNDQRSIYESILAGGCTFIKNVPGYRSPPYAPVPKDILPQSIMTLFKKAFSGRKNDVPKASEWYAELVKIAQGRFISDCGWSHHNLPEVVAGSSCPLCAVRKVLRMPGPLQRRHIVTQLPSVQRPQFQSVRQAVPAPPFAGASNQASASVSTPASAARTSGPSFAPVSASTSASGPSFAQASAPVFASARSSAAPMSGSAPVSATAPQPVLGQPANRFRLFEELFDRLVQVKTQVKTSVCGYLVSRKPKFVAATRKVFGWCWAVALIMSVLSLLLTAWNHAAAAGGEVFLDLGVWALLGQVVISAYTAMEKNADLGVTASVLGLIGTEKVSGMIGISSTLAEPVLCALVLISLAYMLITRK